jgi:hypothetical protein
MMRHLAMSATVAVLTAVAGPLTYATYQTQPAQLARPPPPPPPPPPGPR